MASIQRYEIHSKRSGRTERRYRVHYRDAAGRQAASPTFRRRADAQDFLDGLGHRRVTGTLEDRRAGRQTFRELWDEVHQRREYAAATRTLHAHVWRLLEPLADRSIGEISPAAVARVLDRIQSPGMRGKARSVASAMFSHAVDEGRIPSNPARSRRTDRTRAAQRTRTEQGRTHLTPDSVARLTAEVPERYRPLMRLMAVVGLRPGEAYAPTVGQVGPVLTVDRATGEHPTGAPRNETKTGGSRTLPLPRPLYELRDHIAPYSDPTDRAALVFTTATGTPVEHGAFRHLLARACRRATVEPIVTPNDLRHYAAAYAVARGATIYDVQRMLGHARPSITLDVYAYLFEGSLEGLAERIGDALRTETHA